jgi:hypothetical protein
MSLLLRRLGPRRGGGVAVAMVRCRSTDRCSGRIAGRALLLSTEQLVRQRLEARVCNRSNQPSRKIVNNKHIASIHPPQPYRQRRRSKSACRPAR